MLVSLGHSVSWRRSEMGPLEHEGSPPANSPSFAGRQRGEVPSTGSARYRGVASATSLTLRLPERLLLHHLAQVSTPIHNRSIENWCPGAGCPFYMESMVWHRVGPTRPYRTYSSVFNITSVPPGAIYVLVIIQSAGAAAGKTATPIDCELMDASRRRNRPDSVIFTCTVRGDDATPATSRQKAAPPQDGCPYCQRRRFISDSIWDRSAAECRDTRKLRRPLMILFP